MKMFQEYKIKDMILKNRIAMPPMCLDSAESDGKVKDFHFINYVDRAIGGVGLIIMEATAVAANGRITNMDLGLWEDSQIEGLKRIVEACQSYGTKIALQIAHAGRKCEVETESIIAPSALRFNENYQTPRAMAKEDIKEVIESFKQAASRAEAAGFDAIEIHGAHGYLIHEFLSPLTNERIDDYGGNIENRVRFLREILSEVRKTWPEHKPIILRVSAEDYCQGGINVDEMVNIINHVKDLIDMVHVSSGGLVTVPIDVYPGYQVKLCETIKNMCNMPAIAVGLITESEQVEEILKNGRADLVALGRELLRNPYWVLQAAKKHDASVDVPAQYRRAFNIRKGGF